MIKNNTIDSFSEALFQLESNNIQKLKKELELIIELIHSNKLDIFFQKKRILIENKRKLIDESFSKSFSKLIINTLKLIIDKNQSHIINNVLNETLNKCNKKLGFVNGDVFTTKPLDKNTIKIIEEKISKKINKNVKLKNTINNFIIGGIKVIVEDKVWDYSVIKKIKNIENTIKSKELL